MQRSASLFDDTHAEIDEHMTRIVLADRQNRSICFDALQAVLPPYLAKLETNGSADAARFAASCQTYLRALATYPATSDEWLDVLRAFKHLLDKHRSTLRL